MAEPVTGASKEHKPKERPRRRILGVCLRALRVTLIIALVVIVGCVIYLAQIGLPPGMQERLTSRLRQQGWEVQLGKVRWSFSRMGVVAENVYLRRAAGPQIYARRAQCRMRTSALRRFKFEIAMVKLSGARIIWPLEKTHEPSSTFLLNNISGELHLREGDLWDLQSFKATLMGARVNLSGTLTNGSLVRDWRVPQLRKGVGAENLAKWRAVLNAAHQIDFEGTPEIVTRFDADAARLSNSTANLVVHVPGVTSPWGGGSNLLISAHLNDEPGLLSHPLELDVLFERGATPWAQATGFRFKTRIGVDFAHLIAPTNLTALIEAKTITGPWGTANQVSGDVLLAGSPEQAPGLQTIFNLNTGAIGHERFESATTEIRATAWHARTNWFIAILRDLAVTNRPLSERLQHMPLEAAFSLSGARAGAVDADELLVRTKWSYPVATLAVEGKIEEGGIRGTGTFNATNYQTDFTASSEVDPHRISPLLTEGARHWLTNYQWQAAPKVQAKGRFAFSGATNKVDWARDVLPTVFAEGSFEIGPCRYRAVPVDSAKSRFWFSNSVFCLPDMELRRSEGAARGTYTSRPASKDFHWRLSSRMDPKVLRPLFPTPAEQKAFSLVEFSSPPRVSGEVWGRWSDPSRLGVVASIEATNFTVRGQPVQSARAGLAFTNMQLQLIEPEVRRPNEHGTASTVTIDIKDQFIYFTNVQANLNPYATSRAIGPSAANAIAPYIFATPPQIELNGVLDIKSGRRRDDMHFLISGGPFYWAPFSSQPASPLTVQTSVLFRIHRIGGKIHWAGYDLFLNDVIAQAHEGQATGDAKFHFPSETQPGTEHARGAEFSFRTEWNDINLHGLVRDLSPRTNNLEGIIRGNLQITTASTGNPKSWNGRGMVELKDGLLWDFPMFGVFSPILNAFAPGLGNSRARDGAASYIITNSVVHTTDLEINATAMRMQFSGIIDFDRRIDGTMEAELLRNIPAIGFLISKILWPVTKIFEYKITGTLEQPKTEPLYLLPKVILFPFSPIKSIRDLFSVDPAPSRDPQ